MYPNQSPAPIPTPATYLDEIAAPSTQPTMNPVLLWALIGGAILTIIIVGMMILNGGPSQTDRLKQFVYRVDALQQLSVDNAKNIQDSKLLAANAQMSSVLRGISQQSAEPLAKNGVKQLQKAPKDSPVTAEYAELATTLDDARLNVVFDRTYSREVTYQLRTLQAEATALYKNTRSKSLKSYLETADTNLKSLESQFATFNEGG